MSALPLLLDTHYWIWWQLEPERLGDAQRQAIREAVESEHLLVSVISVWELAVLLSKRRVELDRPCEEWVRTALDLPGVRLAPLTVEIAIDSTRLDLHRDPADRILVATARRLGARLLTADRRLLEYGAKHRLPIVSG